MNQLLLLLIVSLTSLVSSDAISVPPPPLDVKMSKLGLANVGHAVQTDIGGKRSLRGLASTDGAANEERGVTELAEKSKAWVSKFKDRATKTKLGQKIQAWAKERSKAKAAQKMKMTKFLVKNDVSFETFYRNKITPQEYYKAKGFNPNLIYVERTPVVSENNPGYEKWLHYVKYWNAMNQQPFWVRWTVR